VPTKLLAFLRQNGIALLALFVALGGTGYALGGQPLAHSASAGCGPRQAAGYAGINGLAAKFPKSYTTSKPYLFAAFNCSGKLVQVRRAGKGLYVIRFSDNHGRLGFGNAPACVEVTKVLCLAANGRTVSLTKIPHGPDAGAFQVLVQDSVTGSAVDAIVHVLIA
jgi:hypothetical protein